MNFPLRITFEKSAGTRPNHTQYTFTYKDGLGNTLGQTSQLFPDDAPVSELASYVRDRFTQKLRLGDLPNSFTLSLAPNDVFILLS